MGSHGLPRRYYDYPAKFTALNQLSTLGSYCLGFGIVLSIVTVIVAMFKGKKAPDNPWGSNTLEWKTSSPPYHENFTTQPVVTSGPYDYHS